MTWVSFIDFWIMRELGQEDTVFRNYDLMKYAGRNEGYVGQLCQAMKRIGMDGRRIGKWENADNFLPEIAQRIADQYNVPRPDYAQVRIRLIAWYTWDRIHAGELRQWFLSEHVKKARAEG